jgi:hypothetical protein
MDSVTDNCVHLTPKIMKEIIRSCGLQGFAPPLHPYPLMVFSHQLADTPMAFRSSRADHHLSVWFVWC